MNTPTSTGIPVTSAKTTTPARTLPAPKPPQPRNPVAAAPPALTKPPVAPPRPAAPPAVTRAPAPAAGSVKPVQRVVKASEITAEALFQRLYWLETAYRHHRAFIKDLSARLQRTGTAVPAMPHMDALKSAAGDIDPNVG